MRFVSTACSCLLLASLWMASPGLGSVIDSPSGAAAQADSSAEEIVAAYIEAIGGIDAVKAVSSRQVTYRVHMFGRDGYLMERTWTRPDTMRTGAPGASMYTLTEGEGSWRVGPQGRQELPDLVARSMSRTADIDGPLVDPAAKGVTLEYVGVVPYDLVELHHVTATFSDGVQWEYFFDTGTGLLRKLTQPSFVMLNGQISRGADAHHFYFDYRAVGGVMYPHLWVQSAEDHTHLFVVEDIQIQE